VLAGSGIADAVPCLPKAGALTDKGNLAWSAKAALYGWTGTRKRDGDCKYADTYVKQKGCCAMHNSPKLL